MFIGKELPSPRAGQSHSRRCCRVVESFRKYGQPPIRVLAHLGRADDVLRMHQPRQELPVRISSG